MLVLPFLTPPIQGSLFLTKYYRSYHPKLLTAVSDCVQKPLWMQLAYVLSFSFGQSPIGHPRKILLSILMLSPNTGDHVEVVVHLEDFAVSV